MNGDVILMIAAFGVVSSMVLIVSVVAGSRGGALENRLAGSSRARERDGVLRSVWSWLPNLGAVLMPQREAGRARVQTTLVQAGFYRSHHTGIFFGLKLVLMVCPVLVGLLLSGAGVMPWNTAILVGAVAGLAGTLAPGFWLRSLKTNRQKKIRRALPDALDVIVICLEGGLSLPAAFARVSDELYAAYPLLAAEMLIIRKQIELGQSTGEAFQDLADRFDVEELRSMAVLITQAERFGASLVRTLRIQADGLRLKRHLYAETQAQKAPLKLIFPTVLCMFPALYIVLMGPAGVQVMKVLEGMSK